MTHRRRPARPAVAEHLLLVGMMGAGKSTVARLVATRLGRPYVDTDVEVERAVGSSVREIFSERGETGFRAEESRVLDAVLGQSDPAVISVGGGAILDPAHRAALRASGTVVWLRARPETLARRVGRNADRPLLAAHAGGPAAALTEIEAQRRSLYEEVATVVIDVDDLTARAVAERVVSSIPARSADAGASSAPARSSGPGSSDAGRPTDPSKQQSEESR
jgi:shikimate kinase